MNAAKRSARDADTGLAPLPLEEAEARPEDAPVVTHAKRPAWGIGLLAWRTRTKLGVQFEDGRFRRFRREYEHLFEPATMSEQEKVLAVEMLLEALGDNDIDAAEVSVTAASAVSRSGVLDAQVGLFRDQFDGAFRGELWLTDQRGDLADRRYKRHLSPAAEAAAELLTEPVLKTRIEADAAAAWNDAVALVASTDLVVPSELKRLVTDEDGAARMGVALYNRLHGKRSERARFRRFARTVEREFGAPIGWGLATVFPALLRPDRDVVVRPSIAKAFTRLFDIDLKVARKPRYPTYLHYRQLLKEVRNQLESSDLHPADLLDVQRFMRLTLSPSAREGLERFIEASTPAPASAAVPA